MKQLATYFPYQLDPGAPMFDYASFKPRRAVRAIIFDGERVALIHVQNGGYYMLPGGGVDNDETLQIALQREVEEELGLTVSIGYEVGQVTLYMDRWSTKQTDYCFTADKLQASNSQALTDF